MFTCDKVLSGDQVWKKRPKHEGRKIPAGRDRWKNGGDGPGKLDAGKRGRSREVHGESDQTAIALEKVEKIGKLISGLRVKQGSDDLQGEVRDGAWTENLPL